MGVLRTIHGNVASECTTTGSGSGSPGSCTGSISAGFCVPAAAGCGLSDAAGRLLLLSAISRVRSSAGISLIRYSRCSCDQRSWPHCFRRHPARLRLLRRLLWLLARVSTSVLRRSSWPSGIRCARRRALSPIREMADVGNTRIPRFPTSAIRHFPLVPAARKAISG